MEWSSRADIEEVRDEYNSQRHPPRWFHCATCPGVRAKYKPAEIPNRVRDRRLVVEGHIDYVSALAVVFGSLSAL